MRLYELATNPISQILYSIGWAMLVTVLLTVVIQLWLSSSDKDGWL